MQSAVWIQFMIGEDAAHYSLLSKWWILSRCGCIRVVACHRIRLFIYALVKSEAFCLERPEGISLEASIRCTHLVVHFNV